MSNRELIERLRSPATVFYEYAADDGALLKQAADALEQMEWVSVEAEPPPANIPLLATYKNSLGKTRTIKAMWVPRFTHEGMNEFEDLDLDYSEDTDTYYWPEGWYECLDNWDDYSYILVYQGTPTDYQPLPTPPGESP